MTERSAEVGTGATIPRRTYILRPVPKLLVIIASTRPGRIGVPVANWFMEQAAAHSGFELELADLFEVDLPLLETVDLEPVEQLLGLRLGEAAYFQPLHFIRRIRGRCRRDRGHPANRRPGDADGHHQRP